MSREPSDATQFKSVRKGKTSTKRVPNVRDDDGGLHRGDSLCSYRVIHLDRVQRARQQQLQPRVIEALSVVFKALGDPSRVRIVMALSRGEMCVCDLAALLRISESAVSHHLRKLRDLRLVRPRRDAQVLYYALDDDHVDQLVSQALEHVLHDMGKHDR